MGDHIKIPLEVRYFLNELFEMQRNTIVGQRERKQQSELVDSIKESNTRRKITRFVEKGAHRHSEERVVTYLFNQRMIKSTCLLDSGINMKKLSLPAWEIVLDQTRQQTCLAVPLQISNSIHQSVEGKEPRRRWQRTTVWNIWFVSCQGLLKLARTKRPICWDASLTLGPCQCWIFKLYILELWNNSAHCITKMAHQKQ